VRCAISVWWVKPCIFQALMLERAACCSGSRRAKLGEMESLLSEIHVCERGPCQADNVHHRVLAGFLECGS